MSEFKTIEEVEAEAIRHAVSRMNLSAAARTLGIDRRTLYRKMARYGISTSWAAMERLKGTVPEAGSDYYDIVFHAREPGDRPMEFIFVEVEDSSGKSCRLGKWVEREDKRWVLRIERKAATVKVELDQQFEARLKAAEQTAEEVRRDVTAARLEAIAALVDARILGLRDGFNIAKDNEDNEKFLEEEIAKVHERRKALGL
jgi:hypothetical protein